MDDLLPVSFSFSIFVRYILYTPCWQWYKDGRAGLVFDQLAQSLNFCAKHGKLKILHKVARYILSPFISYYSPRFTVQYLRKKVISFLYWFRTVVVRPKKYIYFALHDRTKHQSTGCITLLDKFSCWAQALDALRHSCFQSIGRLDNCGLAGNCVAINHWVRDCLVYLGCQRNAAQFLTP